MKVFLLIAVMCFLSALLVARDLTEVAKKERARRQALSAAREGKPVKLWTDSDLDRYHRPGMSSTPVKSRRSFISPPRDLAKEQAFWQREKVKHQRELARIDARIRRLEWRLAERRAKRRAGGRLHDDPVERALEQSLESMRSERKRLVEEFQERGRKAGALPGWLR